MPGLPKHFALGRPGRDENRAAQAPSSEMAVQIEWPLEAGPGDRSVDAVKITEAGAARFA